ncbi:12061_t:CDS:2 [Acaulospora colombiana]|uniref:12061_t:CDS:1 n=1 Tax=Acaulospora colombiana TaxID=27376 RepID=A0ACA9KS61_9GLOM|nr:12061_t:CDS:2 [Acaulospora colombiana]
MTTPFNLPSLDSAYNLPIFQQLPQQQKFHHHQQQAVEATVVSNIFANPTSFLPPQQQQAVAQLAYLYNSSNCNTDSCPPTQPSTIQHAFLYNPTAYPSPPLDASTALPSSRMNTNDSGDHHNNNDNNQNYHHNGSMIPDSSHLAPSQPSFNPDQKTHTIPTITEGYQTAASYPAPQYHPPQTQVDRRTNVPMVSINHPTKIEPGTSEGSTETWTRIPGAAETAGTTPYPFGPYTTKSAKGYDDTAFFTDPSMKIPPGSSTAPQMGYFNPGPVGYDRNGIPHPVNFGNAMPTPQDYPMPIAAMQNQSGNGARNTPQFNPSRPSVPAPQTMMTTFSSKTVSSTPKRYKCNICQKRFTRPSSLQTHTYSHTGEKRMSMPIRLT